MSKMAHVAQYASHQRNRLKRKAGSLVQVNMQIDGKIGLNYWAWLLWYILFFIQSQAGKNGESKNQI